MSDNMPLEENELQPLDEAAPNDTATSMSGAVDTEDAVSYVVVLDELPPQPPPRPQPQPHEPTGSNEQVLLVARPRIIYPLPYEIVNGSLETAEERARRPPGEEEVETLTVMVDETEQLQAEKVVWKAEEKQLVAEVRQLRKLQRYLAMPAKLMRIQDEQQEMRWRIIIITVRSTVYARGPMSIRAQPRPRPTTGPPSKQPYKSPYAVANSRGGGAWKPGAGRQKPSPVAPFKTLNHQSSSVDSANEDNNSSSASTPMKGEAKPLTNLAAPRQPLAAAAAGAGRMKASRSNEFQRNK